MLSYMHKASATGVSGQMTSNKLYRHVKRSFDFVLSGMGIVILSPLLLIIALWIKCDSKGPVFFKQKRFGQNKVFFEILKFRTMRIDAPHDVPTHLLSDPYAFITKSGHFLRKTSLDELPQLFNIFVGQMSIIGPRPALWNQLDLIEERDKYNANAIRPGLTGWAQVNGRDELLISDKARFDGEYARHMSFKMDWSCFWLTVGGVLKSKGIVEGGTGVMAKQRKKRQTEIQDASLASDVQDEGISR